MLEYLGRYTHRVAITNNRILSIEDGEVAFTYRDRSDENKVKDLTLKVQEMMIRLTGVDLSLCPECGKGKMVSIVKKIRILYYTGEVRLFLANIAPKLTCLTAQNQ